MISEHRLRASGDVRWPAMLGVMLLLLSAHEQTSAQGSGDPTPISGNVHEIIELTADDGVVIPAILMYPETGLDRHSPALVFHHGGFGGHPARQVGAPRFAAERLAAAGYATLSLLSRQSAGHIDSLYEESQKDIKAAIDYFDNLGIEDIVLLAHSLGSIRIAGYLADTKDPRVKAAVHFAPTADMPEAIPGWASREGVEARIRKAREAVAAGRGRMDLSDDPDRSKGIETDEFIDILFTFQSPEAYLNWWGPDARTRNSERFAEIEVPMLMLAGSEDPYVPPGRMEQLKKAAINSPIVDYIGYENGDHFFSGFQDRAAADAIRWLSEQGLGSRSPIHTRLVDARLATGRYFPGVLYGPGEEGDGTRPVFLIQNGFGATIMEGPGHWLATRLARSGFAALTPMTRASGFTGSIIANLDEIVDDLGKWMDFLEDRGSRRIVLVGHGLGANLTAIYAAETGDPRVAGLVFLGPIGDLPQWARQSLGSDRYESILSRAARDVENGGSQLITDKFYLPPPARNGERGMFGQRSGSWLDFFGPGARTVLTERLAEIESPIAVLAGSNDYLVGRDIPGKLENAAAGPVRVLWYGGPNGADHWFSGLRNQAASDVAAWTREVLR